MSPNPTTSHLDQDTEGHTVRRRRIALIAVCATAFVASAGGIALARGGDDPASVPAPTAHTALTCVQLAQMGPGANNSLSPAALAGWRQLWTEAHC